MAVVAGAMLDPGYRSALSGTDAGRAWFAEEQGRVHALVNRAWPRALGTTPMGMARALTVHSRGRGVRYRWRLWRGPRDRLADVLAAVGSDWPVPMLVGRVIPRHWVLIVEASADLLHCYEPSSGEVLHGRGPRGSARSPARAGLSAALRVRAAELRHPLGHGLIGRFR